MATYKVLQDIEAEDKFLGPLTIKQFIFGAIAVVGSYLSVLLVMNNLWFIAFFLLPIILFTGFLAFPWGRDQPTETWLLAKLRYMFKPRKRIWDQTGMQELVKITAPKKIEAYYSDNLSQTEVKSRLKALADTIDSRGWAVKSIAVGGAQPMYGSSTNTYTTDRLVDSLTLPQVDEDNNATDMEDIFDERKLAEISSRLSTSQANHKQAVVEHLREPVTTQNTNTNLADASPWFLGPDKTTRSDKPLPTSEKQNSYSSAEKIQSKNDQKNHTPTVTATPDPVTIELARNNDRNIESLAREINQVRLQQSDDEVVISLH